jgi:hypothetical protein
MFKLHELALALEANAKSWTYTDWKENTSKSIADTVEMGRPENPSLHKGTKLFIWMETPTIPKDEQQIRAPDKMVIKSRLIHLIAGTGHDEAVTLYQIVDEIFHKMDGLKLGLTGCVVQLPETPTADIKPVVLGSEKTPNYCLGAEIDFQIVKVDERE